MKYISQEEFVDILIQDSLIQQVNKLGLEKVKELILRNYTNNPLCKEKMLKNYEKIYFSKK